MNIAEFIEERLGENGWIESTLAEEEALRYVRACQAIAVIHSSDNDPCAFSRVPLLNDLWCPTVLHLAAIWHDHPAYRQEWKP